MQPGSGRSAVLRFVSKVVPAAPPRSAMRSIVPKAPIFVAQAVKSAPSLPSSFPARQPARALSTRAPPAAPRGVFGVSFLTSPAAFARAAEVAVAVCAPLIAGIAPPAPASAAAAAPPPPLLVLRSLDTISDTVCKVLDAAECARNVHGDAAWRAAADATFHSLSEYMYALNAHQPLYDALRRVTEDAAAMAALGEEQRRMGRTLRREFERDGIHLDAEARADVVRLNSLAGQLASRFLQNIGAAGAAGDGAGDGAGGGAGPGSGAGPGGAAQHSHFERAARLAADPAVAAEVLRLAASEALRRDVLVALNAAPARGAQRAPAAADAPATLDALDALAAGGAGADNVRLLHALRDVRARLAARIGFASYAHMVASDRMAGRPENAVAFLQALARALAPRAAADLALLAAEKAAHRAASPRELIDAAQPARLSAAAATAAVQPKHAGSLAAVAEGAARALVEAHAGAGAGAGAGAPPPLQPWDTSFYQVRATQSLLRAAEPALGGAAGAAPDAGAPDPLRDAAEVAEYLTLANVLSGLQLVMRRVFGVTMVAVPVEPGEGWTGPAGAGASGEGGDAAGGAVAATATAAAAAAAAPGPAPLLHKFVLRHDVEGALGTMFLDLFARPGKFPGAAHFVVRCGKLLHEVDGAFERAMGVDAQVFSVGGARGQSFQLPIVTLVTNYSPPEPEAGAGSGAGSAPASAAAAAAAVLMSPQEVETLFHEFGHALHSLLSRTEFQHLSGTRGALDFVEVPSHLLEYFARDFRVVSAFARHRATQAPLPEPLWARVQAARAAFAGLELQQSLAAALFDQALFGGEAAAAAVLGPRGAAREGDAEAVAAALAAAAPAAPGAPRRLPRLPRGFLSDGEFAIPLTAEAADAPGAPDAPDADTGAGAGAGARARAAREAAPDSTALLAAIHSRYCAAPALAHSRWHAGFTHAATYGGGYYTYLYAAALSAALWRRLFAKNPFDRAAGELLRAQVLARGAGADPVAMVRAVLGGAPTIAPLLLELGLIDEAEAARVEEATRAAERGMAAVPAAGAAGAAGAEQLR